MRTVPILVGVILLNAAAALAADTPATPQALYERGDYDASVAAGEAKGDGQSLAIAARAQLDEARLRDTPCLDCLKKGEALARRAIAADAKAAGGYIYLAVALGYEGHIIGTSAARSQKFPEQSRQAIDMALKLEPNNPYALAADGGWHIEVVRLAGKLLASLMYGADFDKGAADFKHAMSADPGNLTVAYEYMLQLTAYDLKGQRTEIASLLAAALADTPRTAYERALQGRVRELSGLLTKNDLETFATRVKRFQGYP